MGTIQAIIDSRTPDICRKAHGKETQVPDELFLSHDTGDEKNRCRCFITATAMPAGFEICSFEDATQYGLGSSTTRLVWCKSGLVFWHIGNGYDEVTWLRPIPNLVHEMLSAGSAAPASYLCHACAEAAGSDYHHPCVSATGRTAHLFPGCICRGNHTGVTNPDLMPSDGDEAVESAKKDAAALSAGHVPFDKPTEVPHLSKWTIQLGDGYIARFIVDEKNYVLYGPDGEPVRSSFTTVYGQFMILRREWEQRNA